MTASDRSVDGLLAQQDFVRRLARRLLGEHEADDLTQDAYLHTLRSEANVEAPRPWLARVVRRLAANRRRDHGRRVRRERDVGTGASPTAPSTASILACEEARRQVVEAVLALDEPFRGTVLARYYEGLETPAIAIRDGIAEATVRSRLRRGLQRLRVDLDRHHGGRREGWAGPLALLVPGAQTPRGPALPPASGRATLLTATLVGVITLSWVVAEATSTTTAGPSSGSGAGPMADGGGAVTTNAVSREPDADGRDGLQRVAISQSPALPILDVPVDDVEVRVIASATLRPVAGAVVYFQPFRVDAQHPTVRLDPELADRVKRADFVRTHGSRTETDDAGLARIRVPRTGGDVVAEHDGGRRLATVRPQRLMHGERVELALQAVRQLRFRLIDEVSGDPVAGHDIRLRWQGSSPLRDPIETYTQGRNQGLVAGPSGTDGMIACAVEATCRRLLVCVRTRGPESWRPVDLSTALGGVVDVPCATVGNMTVELLTPSGKRWPASIAVQLHHSESGNRVFVTGDEVSWHNAEPGLCRIANLELGVTWRVRVNPMGAYRDAVTTTVRGPVHADDERRVTLTASHEPCVIEATLRLTSGSPPSQSSKVFVSADDFGLRTRSWCDDAGRIAFCLPVGKPAAGVISLEPQARGGALWSRWQLDGKATSGRHAIGPLVLTGAKAVVAGRVDVGDQPWRGPPLMLRLEEPADDDDWRHLAFAEVHPTDSPRFRIAGHTDSQRLRVSVLGSRHHLPVEPAVVEAGTEDLRFEVERGLPLRARVLTPPAYAAALRCRVVPEDGTALPPYTFENFDDVERSRAEAVLIDRDADSSHFLWPALPAGTYRVEVLAPGLDTPLASIAVVELTADADDDDRLDPIDVRTAARAVTVRIDPAQVAPYRASEGGAVAWATNGAADEHHGLLFDDDGRARLLVGPGPIDLLVVAPGHRFWRRSAIHDTEVTVDLEPCHQPSFRLADAVAERLRGHRVQLRLLPWEASTDEERARWQNPATGKHRSCSFHYQGTREWTVGGGLSGLRGLLGTGYATIDNGATGELTVPVADTGSYRLELRVGRADRKGWASGAGIAVLESLQPSIVEVTGKYEETFVVEVDENEFAEALEYLGADR